MLVQVGAGIQVPPNSTRILSSRDGGLLPVVKAVFVRSENFSSSPTAMAGSSEPNHLSRTLNQLTSFPISISTAQTTTGSSSWKLGVEIHLDSFGTAIDFELPAVHIENRSNPFFADLSVGADDLKSVCRGSLLNRPKPTHLTGDLAYRITIPADHIHGHPLLKALVYGILDGPQQPRRQLPPERRQPE